MKASQIISKLPYKCFQSRTSYANRNKRAIEKAGYTPVKPHYDKAGNCVICGEAGRCPSWHTIDDLEAIK